MPILTIPTQFGPLTLWEDDSAIVRLDWDGDGTDDTPLLVEAARQVQAYAAGTLTEFDLPLRIKGSDFQRDVCAQM
jgi:methylated-DNA-[protein]-cysteine S-methyltransferase